MIVVTGTKRSGTSMWMQILKAAGFPVLGRAFPRDWGETIREANRAGFYESSLRHGIYHATNPHPRTGEFLSPAATTRHAVKVFAPGLCKTERAYLDFVIVSLRDPREYEASLARLYALEHENKLLRAERAGRPAAGVPQLAFAPALLEWWHDNVTLLEDAARRRYPIRFVSYAAVLREPASLVGDTLAWLGAGDHERAVQAVQAELRTQRARSGRPRQANEHAERCDALYRHLAQGAPLDAAFMRKLRRASRELEPQIEAAERAARSARQRERARARAARQC